MVGAIADSLLRLLKDLRNWKDVKQMKAIKVMQWLQRLRRETARHSLNIVLFQAEKWNRLTFVSRGSICFPPSGHSPWAIVRIHEFNYYCCLQLFKSVEIFTTYSLDPCHSPLQTCRLLQVSSTDILPKQSVSMVQICVWEAIAAEKNNKSFAIHGSCLETYTTVSHASWCRVISLKTKLFRV